MRRLATAALLAATIWLPTVLMPPVVQAAVCTGWSSTTAPPPAIRVLRSATGVVQAVDFETYVKVVMPAEWPSTWPMESLRAGAVAVKQYAWYYAIHYRGGTGTGGCYDVADNTNDQIYSPETRTPAASHIQAVESTWPESITKNGSFILTGYGPGSDVACGTDADGYHLYQHSARNCALGGKTGEEILHVYFDPGAAIQVTPTLPATYHTLTPARVLDSRISLGAGLFHSQTKQTFTVATAASGVPTSAVAVTGNVTIVGQARNGYVTVAPSLTSGVQPPTSTINFPVGDIRANGITVPLAPGGKLDAMYWSSSTADTVNVIFDVTGYFSSDATGATYHTLTPARVLDSRISLGAGLFHSQTKQTFTVATAASGVPTSAVAVTGNVTIVGQARNGYVTVAPSLTSGVQPPTSTINFPVGDIRANGITVPLAPGGKLDAMYWSSSTADTVNVIFDVTGYFT
jgi:hypothetical protein